MRLLRRYIEKDGSGSVSVIPDEPEDFWHLYNLIQSGDQIKSTALRKVTKQTATGSTDSQRVRVQMTIEVKNVYFDPGDSILRVNGKNVTELEYVKRGQFQTLELELNRQLTLIKHEWDAIALERLTEATDPTRSADVAAIVMSEGIANLCLITSSMTIVRARLEANIPRKRKGGEANYDKSINKFFETILQTIIRHVNFAVVKCLIIASPGFLKDQFKEFLFAEATRREIKLILENKEKILLCHSSSGHKHSLQEILSQPQVLLRLIDTKATGEVRVLNEFMEIFNSNPDRAFYGIRHVMKASEHNAIQTLLVSDSLFRAASIATRKKYVELVQSVKDGGGKVHIFSSLHVSGEQLKNLSGVAAILRYPLPEIEDEENENEDHVEEQENEENNEGNEDVVEADAQEGDQDDGALSLGEDEEDNDDEEEEFENDNEEDTLRDDVKQGNNEQEDY